MAETCCAKEKKINYQTEGFEGLSKKRSEKINKQGCLADDVRRRKGPSPKSLNLDEDFKP